MNSKVKGLIVEIGGDTSGLQKALSSVESKTKSLQTELRGINTLLKFDPKNTELLSQKQKVLSDAIKSTKQEIENLKKAQDLFIESGGDLNSEEYRNLQREIINTQRKLEDMQEQASKWSQAGISLQEFGDKLEKIGEKAISIGKKLTTAITLPIAGLMTAGVNYNSQIEQYQTALTTLTGSSEEAADIIEQIKKDAKTTPFNVTNLTKAERLLIATGISGADARKVILALGDAVSAVGGGDDELSRMAVNLQQIKNVGKASALDIKQFAYAGIDVYGLLADYLGVTREEAAGMKVTFDDLSGALLQASSQGGKYFGAMDKQSQTFAGKLSNLKDSFEQFTGKLAETLMPVLQKVMDKLIGIMDKFQQLPAETQEAITNFLTIAAGLGPVLTVVGNIAKGFGNIFDFAGKAIEGIGNFIIKSKDMPVVGEIVQGVTGFFSGLSGTIGGIPRISCFSRWCFSRFSSISNCKIT